MSLSLAILWLWNQLELQGSWISAITQLIWGYKRCGNHQWKAYPRFRRKTYNIVYTFFKNKSHFYKKLGSLQIIFTHENMLCRVRFTLRKVSWINHRGPLSCVGLLKNIVYSFFQNSSLCYFAVFLYHFLLLHYFYFVIIHDNWFNDVYLFFLWANFLKEFDIVDTLRIIWLSQCNSITLFLSLSISFVEINVIMLSWISHLS